MAKGTGTPDLFRPSAPPSPLAGSMNFASEVAHLVSAVLKASPADRYEIAARMSRLEGREVSKFMLDAWAAESRETHNIPFYHVPVLEVALGSHALTDWLVTRRGGQVAYGKDVLAAKLGQLELMKQQVADEIRDLKKLLGESG